MLLACKIARSFVFSLFNNVLAQLNSVLYTKFLLVKKEFFLQALTLIKHSFSRLFQLKVQLCLLKFYDPYHQLLCPFVVRNGFVPISAYFSFFPSIFSLNFVS